MDNVSRGRTATANRWVRSTGIKVPDPSDCLFGRGYSSQKHQGNLNMHRLIDLRLGEYLCASPQEKRRLVAEVVRIIHEGDPTSDTPPGRFLKRQVERMSDGGAKVYWDEVDEVDAVKKVEQTFRFRNRRAQKPGTVVKRETLRCRSSGIDHAKISALIRGERPSATKPKAEAVSADEQAPDGEMPNDSPAARPNADRVKISPSLGEVAQRPASVVDPMTVPGNEYFDLSLGGVLQRPNLSYPLPGVTFLPNPSLIIPFAPTTNTLLQLQLQTIRDSTMTSTFTNIQPVRRFNSTNPYIGAWFNNGRL